MIRKTTSARPSEKQSPPRNNLKISEVLEKEEFDESLPRVEYRLSPAGERLIPILRDIRELGETFSRDVTR